MSSLQVHYFLSYGEITKIDLVNALFAPNFTVFVFFFLKKTIEKRGK